MRSLPRCTLMSGLAQSSVSSRAASAASRLAIIFRRFGVVDRSRPVQSTRSAVSAPTNRPAGRQRRRGRAPVPDAACAARALGAPSFQIGARGHARRHDARHSNRPARRAWRTCSSRSAAGRGALESKHHRSALRAETAQRFDGRCPGASGRHAARPRHRRSARHSGPRSRKDPAGSGAMGPWASGSHGRGSAVNGRARSAGRGARDDRCRRARPRRDI